MHGKDAFHKKFSQKNHQTHSSEMVQKVSGITAMENVFLDFGKRQ